MMGQIYLFVHVNSCSASMKVQELDFLKVYQANQMAKLHHVNLHYIERHANDPRCLCLNQNVSSLEVMEVKMLPPLVDMEVKKKT